MTNTSDLYKKTSAEVFKCLDISDWVMKVNGRDNGDRNGSKIVSVEGWINERGIMNCKCASKVTPFFNLQVIKYQGNIDHFGQVSIFPVKSEANPFNVFLSYYASSWQNGEFTLEARRKDSTISLNNKVTSLIGNMLESKNELRDRFLAERKKLYDEIRKLKVRV